jgi:hypothetical protein
MRLLAILLVPILVFSAWQMLRREQNENRLALVASEVAQREVDVGCPGFWTRLVEITPYAGWVDFDENGRPLDRTELSAQTCRSLERLWRAEEPPSFGCLLAAAACPKGTLEIVSGLVTLAHESWHLRGVVDEARTQCYAVQTVEFVARRFGIPIGGAGTVATYVALDDAQATPGEYHSPDCHPGGRLDLRPETAAWPSA